MANWRRYLRFWGPDVDADIDDELRFHLESRVAHYLDAGYAPDDARRLATERFGDPHRIRGALKRHDTRKLHRERRAETMDELAQDIRYGARKLLNAPGFTVAVVAVLALGIGANTAIYSALDAALLRPLPFADPERLVGLEEVNLPSDRRGMPPRPFPKRSPDLPDVRELTGVFSHVAAYATGGLNLVGGDAPIRANVTYVTEDFFPMLGRTTALGRTFTKDESALDGPKVIILSSATWQTQFGGDPHVIGKKVSLSGVSHEVVGVMPGSFQFPALTDVWVATSTPIPRGIMDAFRNFLPSQFIARLQPGVTVASAAASVEVLRRRFRPKPLEDERPVVELVEPLRTSLVGDNAKALPILMGSAGLLLLIACANVTNLLLSRAAVRRREIAVRVMLGATRRRVIRQLVVETLLLGLAGAAAALVVAQASMGALNALMPAQLKAVAPPTLDWRVLTFTLVVAVATSLVCGVWPAVGASKASLTESAKPVLRSGRLRSTLVVVEVALALLLLVGAGLLLGSLRRMFNNELGLNPEHVVTARLSLPRNKYPNPADKSGFVDAVVARLRTAPNVRSAAAVSVLPMADEFAVSIQIRPERPVRDDQRVGSAYIVATPGYFAAIGARLVAGSDLPATVDTTNLVAVINQTAATALWPGENPVGQRFMLGDETRLVVGVVEDIRNNSLDQKPSAQMYFPMAQQPQTYVSILARGTSDAATLAAALRDAVHAVDPTLPLYSVRTLEDIIGASVAPRRVNALLLSIFGSLALVLAAVGVYATLAYSVAQRTREIGVRLALGAQRPDVVSMVLRQGARLIGIGVAVGVAGAYALGRVFASLVYEVSVRDPLVFAAAPVVLVVVGFVATLLPAARAARVDPMVALRQE